MTEWRTIPGFSRYEVSECGGIRVSPHHRKHSSEHLKPGDPIRLHGEEYPSCYLYHDNGCLMRMVSHRAVALAFHGPPPSPNHCALHWDDKRNNNHVSNIRWGTHLDNGSDRTRNGLSFRGEMAGNSKLTEDKVRQIRERYAAGEVMISLGKAFGVGTSTIHQIVTRKTWKHI